MTSFLIIFASIVATIVIAIILRDWLKGRKDRDELHQRVMGDKENYQFLIDKTFHVKDTNYYELNKDVSDDQPHVLGNVLHCQTGCDSGLCGTGIACTSCPVRLIIKNSFKQKRNFEQLKATMHVYDANYQPQVVDVIVDGEFTYVGSEPHMRITVAK